MNQIYQQAADKLGLSFDVVKECGEHSFAWLRLRMSELDIDKHKILYPGLGTFVLVISKLRRAIVVDRLSEKDKEHTINLLNKFDKTNERISSKGK
jgi:hypothetical protein